MKGHVNSSGFPLQIGLQNQISEFSHSTDFSVAYSEHSWSHPENNESGFMDLVLSNSAESIYLNVECKRVKDTSWFFLLEKGSRNLKRRHAKVFVSSKENSIYKKFGWNDITMEPSCPQSSFCVIPGTDRKSKSLIERAASELVVSSEGLAYEGKAIHNEADYHFQTIINVIVTTAKLELCELDSDSFDVNTGTFESMEAREIPYVRYRKQLVSISNIPSNSNLNARDISNLKESTVFVVNAGHFLNFLKELDFDNGYQNRQVFS